MKYKLLKDLPLAKAGKKVELVKKSYTNYSSIIYLKGIISDILDVDIPEWLEEIKEPKTIYDLKHGDEYWNITEGYITEHKVISNFQECAHIENFITEREAKRNKLLRELATRTDKWLPTKSEYYYTPNRQGEIFELPFTDSFDIYQYHCGLVFRNEEEYNKYMTKYAKDLLFNL